MTVREMVKSEIDTLPDEVIDKIQEYVLFQKYRIGISEDDAAYLNSIPGMMDSIKKGLETPLSECTPLLKVWPDV
jgi:hypothetical protein